MHMAPSTASRQRPVFEGRCLPASRLHLPGMFPERLSTMQIWCARGTEHSAKECCCRLTCRLHLPGSGFPCQLWASVQRPVAVAVHRAARCLPVRLPATHPGGLSCPAELLHISQGMDVTTWSCSCPVATKHAKQAELRSRFRAMLAASQLDAAKTRPFDHSLTT